MSYKPSSLKTLRLHGALLFSFTTFASFYQIVDRQDFWIGIPGAAISIFFLMFTFSKRYKSVVERDQWPIIEVSHKEISMSAANSSSLGSIQWEEITRIEIATTDKGPEVCDVFIILYAETKQMTIPSEVDGVKDLLDKIFSFPGFKLGLFTIAMGCSQNERFVVWENQEVQTQ